GEQPIARILSENHLTRNGLVEISTQPITHKMVARACKGRRLTPHAKSKILDALNRATDRTYSMGELFNY
ncbi:MAG: hypothetical protein U1E27_05065, partial [Kiritimatiellia bacterium]|nr:hypothetical protein [Kiritimatiellia bacterium]